MDVWQWNGSQKHPGTCGLSLKIVLCHVKALTALTERKTAQLTQSFQDNFMSCALFSITDNDWKVVTPVFSCSQGHGFTWKSNFQLTRRISTYPCQLSFGQLSLGFAPLVSGQGRDAALGTNASETLTAPGKLGGEQKHHLTIKSTKKDHGSIINVAGGWVWVFPTQELEV